MAEHEQLASSKCMSLVRNKPCLSSAAAAATAMSDAFVVHTAAILPATAESELALSCTTNTVRLHVTFSACSCSAGTHRQLSKTRAKVVLLLAQDSPSHRTEQRPGWLGSCAVAACTAQSPSAGAC